MSRRSGNVNENIFMQQAEALGYCAFAARGSRGVIDVVCFDAEKGEINRFLRYRAPLVVQIGTNHKPIARTLAEVQGTARPIGSLCIVARRMAKKGRSRPWKYTTPYGTFDSLEEAIRARD